MLGSAYGSSANRKYYHRTSSSLLPSLVTIGEIALKPVRAFDATTSKAKMVDRIAIGTTPAPNNTTMLGLGATAGTAYRTLRYGQHAGSNTFYRH